MSQADQPHMVFTDKSSFHKFFTNICTQDLDILQLPTLNNLINSTKHSNYVCQFCATQKQTNKSYIHTEQKQAVDNIKDGIVELLTGISGITKSLQIIQILT